MRITLLALLAGHWATMAVCGPWPREAGSGFLSFSIESPSEGDTRDLYYSVFFEYGLTDTVTAGFDGGTDYYQNGEGYAFLRMPVPFESARHKFALLGGIGARQTVTSLLEPVYVFGGSWGAGFQSDFGPGWAAVDATIRDRQDTDTRLVKVDATLGVNRSSEQIWFAQLRYADDTLAPEPTWQLAPAIAWRLSDRLRLETSASVGLSGTTDAKLKLGLWSEF